MTVIVKLFEWEKKMKRFIFNERWFPILLIILILLLCGWDSRTNIREGLLAIGFLLLGFVLGCLYAQKQFNRIFHLAKERTNILIEDLVSDLSRYALVAGESYDKTKEMIYRYKEYAKSILGNKQQK
jgi:hypothetical protein